MDAERPYLIPLPARPFVAARVEPRLVGYDFCIAWDTNRYSVSPSLVGRSVQGLELDDSLEVYLDGDIIASHRLRDTRHKRYIPPEHESEFRQHSTSRHVLQEQFLRLGEIAQTFTDGLMKAHGGAVGYHISEILKLADQVGIPRVLEALRHAARYGAFSQYLGGADRARQAAEATAGFSDGFRVPTPTRRRVSESLRPPPALD